MSTPSRSLQERLAEALAEALDIMEKEWPPTGEMGELFSRIEALLREAKQ